MSNRLGSMRAHLPCQLATLCYAKDFIGLREEGHNRGPLVELSQRAAGLTEGQPYCAAFVNFCAELGCAITGQYSPLDRVPLQGYVQSYYDHGMRAGWLTSFENVSPGALFLLYHEGKGRYAHIGFVDLPRRSEGTVSTVEGNTAEDGGREGVGIMQHTREVTEGMRFLQWWD